MRVQGWSVLTLALAVRAQRSNYVPSLEACPSTSLIQRTGSPLTGNQQLYPDEAVYISQRRSALQSQWSSYLNDANTGSTGYQASTFTADNQPKMGTAISGGGLRAALYGAGSLSALDSRNNTHAAPALQLSDYLVGLSGGSWVVTSTALNDQPDMYSMVLGGSSEPGWLLDMDILLPDGLLGLSDNNNYYDILLNDTRSKALAGYPTSLVDTWGLALGFHFLNGTTADNFYQPVSHDDGLLFSSIRLTQNFQSFAMPYPILVATSRISQDSQDSSNSSTTVLPLQNTVFEISPYSFGSFDPTLSALVPLNRSGTFLQNGQPANASACVVGFDTAAFMMGSSAALFNAAEELLQSDAVVALLSDLTNSLADIPSTKQSVPLVANWPNSFNSFVPEGGSTFESASNTILQVTDGGENGENVPFNPLLAKARSLDVILALDSSADTTYGWPNGTSLIATAQRTALYTKNFTSFPPVPDTQDLFVEQGLNIRPTFFGCNVTNPNTTAIGSYPLVVYLPNAPPSDIGDSYLTNTSTFKLSYSSSDTVSFLDAAHLNALRGIPDSSGNADGSWPLCLKCATVDRARQRAGVARSAACQTCFTKYCWNDGQNAGAIGNNPTVPAGGSSTGSSSMGGSTTQSGAASILSPLGLPLAVMGLSMLAFI